MPVSKNTKEENAKIRTANKLRIEANKQERLAKKAAKEKAQAEKKATAADKKAAKILLSLSTVKKTSQCSKKGKVVLNPEIIIIKRKHPKTSTTSPPASTPASTPAKKTPKEKKPVVKKTLAMLFPTGRTKGGSVVIISPENHKLEW